MQKITPFLWFDNNAQEAMKFYTSVFKDSSIGEVTMYNDAVAKMSGLPEGTMMTATFNILGQQFMVLNGGPTFKFTEAISFFVSCEDQEEVDYYWNALTQNGGEESQCGWLKDKFGLSWQIVPKQLGQYLGNPDPVKANKAMEAMLKMHKLDIQVFEKAIE